MSKITDTYGRVININRNENDVITGISYTDENGIEQTITYDITTLPSNSLNNTSPSKFNDVTRFTVTNQGGEQTIYDSRKADVTYYYLAGHHENEIITEPDLQDQNSSNTSSYNIERIVYPNGRETYYQYRSIMQVNKYTQCSWSDNRRQGRQSCDAVRV